MKTFLKTLTFLSCLFALLSGDTTAMLVAGVNAAHDDDDAPKAKK